MKQFLFTLIIVFCPTATFSQSFTEEELKTYSALGDKSYKEKATELAQKHPLNNQYELYLSCIKEYPGKSKFELYNKIHNWLIGFSTNSSSAIQVADTSKWVIQARCDIRQIAKRTMGDNHYKVNIRPLLSIDFKDGKIRLTYTLQSYDVLKATDDDGFIFMSGKFGTYSGGEQKKDYQIWPISECYPYAKETSYPKVTSSRALVNSIAIYNILIDRIDKAVNQQDSNSDW